jgi:signal transduction histidine kinase
MDLVQLAEWRSPDGPGRGGIAELRRALPRIEGSVAVAVQGDLALEWVEVPVVETSRAGQVAAVAGALLMTAALMAVPLLLLQRRTSPSAVPFFLFYAAVATMVFGAASGLGSPWLHRLEALALVVMPCALAHMCLTFPAPRPVVVQTPELLRVPYLVGLLFLPIAWAGLERDALLWPAIGSLLIGLAAGTWCVLVASCAFAVRESGTPIQHQRLRVLLCATLLLPLVSAFVLVDASPQGRQVAAQYLLASLALVPLPVGLVLSDYSLFDLGTDARRWSARLALYGVSALIGTALFATSRAVLGEPWTARSPLSLFLACLTCAGLADGVRRTMLEQIEGALSPRARSLTALRDRYTRGITELRDEVDVARMLGNAMAEGLGARRGAVFSSGRRGWKPLHGFGPDPLLDALVAASAGRLLGSQRAVSLSRGQGPQHEILRGFGAELIGALELRGQPIGLVVLSRSPRSAYTRMDLGFLEDACAHGAVALGNARLAEDLLEAERQAATGRTAVSLAHDLGKELDWIRQLAHRLPTIWRDRERSMRDLGLLGDLADEIAEVLRGFVVDATGSGPASAGRVPLVDLVDRCVREVERRHPGPGIVSTLAGGAWEAQVDRDLRHALVNILDNALRAQPQGPPIHLFVDQDAERISIFVRDRGPGLDEESLARAFDPGFTTRTDGSGCGAGLAIARGVVESLGGTIHLESTRARGTRAVIEVPCTPA